MADTTPAPRPGRNARRRAAVERTIEEAYEAGVRDGRAELRALEAERDQALADARSARALAGRYWNNALAAIDRRDAENNRLRLAWQSARRRARQQRDAMAADRDQARREAADLRAQLAATTNPARAEEQLAADTRPGTEGSTT